MPAVRRRQTTERNHHVRAVAGTGICFQEPLIAGADAIGLNAVGH
jgi:hypothetical protein